MDNLITTLSRTGIASSFSNNGNYIISTVKTGSGFETILKTQGQFNSFICLIGALSTKDAMDNHIAMTRMAVSSDSKDWTKENAFQFSPKVIRNGVEKMDLEYDSSNLNCEFCEQFLLMSGINYSSGQETVGQMIKNIAIIFSVLLVLYLIFK
jgi:hypothetical protein